MKQISPSKSTLSSRSPSLAKLFGHCAVSLVLAVSSALALDPKDESVQVSAAISKTPASIALHWESDPNATGYSVSRKLLTATKWALLARLPKTAQGYVDSKVSPGIAYEYRILKSASGYSGYGFILSGVEVPFLENSGKIILVVDETYAAQLAPELSRLVQDLIGDGWTVIRRDVPGNAPVASVKNLIKTEYIADKKNVKAVFLFGHVPVPYSGNFNPDGHGEHRGAWPADAFYGDMDGVFTDKTVNNPGPARAENKNVPGDGKYDQSLIASVELQVGRVDLANMPGLGKSEVELLRQYLEKDHKFRHGQMEVVPKGLIDDHFGVNDSGEAFAVNGWRNFSPLIGAVNIAAANWSTTLSAENYLWAYACSGGSYDGAGGIAETADYATLDLKGVFTMLLGSYFGDWDSTDNFLRAPLGGATGLASAWAGRPNWYFHPMGLGKTTGFCARLTQNNAGVYPTGSGARQPHIALMGDPTLRMHPVAPPADFTATPNGSGGVDLRWTASPETVEGYYLYAGSSPTGPFIPLNGTITTGTSFSHASNPTGKTYMVRAVKLQSSPSGSYFNPSQGVFVTFDGGIVTSPPSGLPVVTVNTTDATASEQGTNTGAFTVTRSGSTSAALQISLSISGLAANGSDYETVADTVTIPAGYASAAITITPLSDAITEGTEDVTVAVLEDEAYVLGDPSSASLEITDTAAVTDDTNPAVAITSPSDGSSVSKTVKINVTATDNLGVIRTELLVDEVLMASTASGSSSFNWDPTPYGAGSHTLKALAYDAAGNVGASSIVVTVKAR